MTDIHCHILPSADDGASDMAEALAMARLAEDCGVKTIVATPHCGVPEADRDNFVSRELYDRFVEFRDAMAAAGLGIKLKAGAEIFCTEETPRLLREGKLLTLASSDYLLTEFYFDMPGAYMDHMLARLAAEGVRPVVAHPERYEASWRDPELVPRWFRSGCVIQLNKGSILGRLGSRAETVSKFLLERGFAHVVASDAHGPNARTPHMTAVLRHLEDNYAPGYARILLSRNPERITQDKWVIRP